VEVQGTAEGEAVPREELDKMVDLALRGVAELVALEARVLANAGVNLANIMTSPK
jgi:ribonuclease PH